MNTPAFKDARHIHFVGIKGVGMTALALCAQDLGITVSGSDVDQVFVTDEVLRQRQLDTITPLLIWGGLSLNWYICTYTPNAILYKITKLWGGKPSIYK